MSLYSGTRSLDAEITLDFSDNTVTMDYSHNDHGNPFMSNTSVKYDSEFDRLSLFRRLIEAIRAIGFIWIFVFLAAIHYQSIMTYLFSKNIITNSKWQYNHQRFMRWTDSNLLGTIKTIVSDTEGKNIVKVHISNNLWVEYELVGQFKEKINTISLKRHFDHFYKFGRYHEIRQNGWDMIFTFTAPPENGSVSVTSIR